MQCPKCQFENPEGIKFCGECGAKLERLCPSCNSPSPPNFKFCGECGQSLPQPISPASKDFSFDEKIAKIKKYLPQGITEKILSQRDKIEGERKQVTVMFCDMMGFTPLSEKLDPETMYTMMDQVYEILIHKVHDYEGTVNEMTGDGIMALPQFCWDTIYIHEILPKFGLSQCIKGLKIEGRNTIYSIT